MPSPSSSSAAADSSLATSSIDKAEQSALFDLISTASEGGPTQTSRLERFLSEPATGAAILEWLGSRFQGNREELSRRLNRDVAAIDRMANAQLNVVLHAEAFQKLEASWRGLQYLVERADEEDEPAIKIRVLNVAWRELERDFERAIEFDQSQLFRKVYESEFGSPGGEPFGILIGDYEIHPRVSAQHPHNDLGVVDSLAGVAAAAFCPIILNASPAMFGLDDFSGLEQRLDHERTFENVEYTKWKSLRAKEDSRFIGLTLPRVLMRTPYEDEGFRVDRFRFQEDVQGPDRSKYLWGGAGYAFGGVLMRAFSEAGWLADIRGARRGIDGGGLVTGLPLHSFRTDAHGLVNKSSTDVIITSELEKQLSDLGFMPLCDSKDTDYSVFYSNQSLQKPVRYDRQAATTNAQLSVMMQYMLCVSRFAHYIKVLGRDKLGAFGEYDELEALLQNWIVQYVTADSEASPETKARFPLRDAEVRVEPSPGRPGSYRCLMRLLPHYELDELQASVRVVAELSPPTPGSAR